MCLEIESQERLKSSSKGVDDEEERKGQNCRGGVTGGSECGMDFCLTLKTKPLCITILFSQRVLFKMYEAHWGGYVIQR